MRGHQCKNEMPRSLFPPGEEKDGSKRRAVGKERLKTGVGHRLSCLDRAARSQRRPRRLPTRSG